MSSFKKATKEKAKGRVALIGPAGAGKTWTALLLARHFAGPKGRIAVIDSEHGTAAKYSDVYSFDHCELTSFAPKMYVEKIREADVEGYDAIVIDSLSHAWVGKDGALEQVDRITQRSNSKNSFNAWGTVTPEQNEFVDAMLACKAHLVVTVRQKMEYVQEIDDRTKKMAVRKIGLKPVQRDGLEYEFDVVCDMDVENTLYVTKTRCSALKGKVVREPGKDFAQTILAWLDDGTAATERAPAPQPAAEASPRPTPAAAERPLEQPAGNDDKAIFAEFSERFGTATRPEQLDAAVADLAKLQLAKDNPMRLALGRVLASCRQRFEKAAAAESAA